MAVAQAAVQAPIVDAIAQAQRSARRDFLWKFSLTWAVIIAALGLVIYATGNADPAFTIEWGPFILGGVGLTIFICVTSIVRRDHPGRHRRARAPVDEPVPEWDRIALRLAGARHSAHRPDLLHLLRPAPDGHRARPASRRASSRWPSTTVPT